ncbi:DoxX family protein [Campylobacter sp. faydin G-24]|uniref:DoxX family protein n=1 Tax=Campylobacter anatolicus TaxID=2829105 RepID=A0ABS5HLA5_9BACT|nr:DoxX family protein [Campylobacter anatolicus]MBR8462638.1 DoxX family protein [Campylobacter anatolicus]MBR8464562.1 DoxX family protein [Campylobacter anatolicus]
MLKNSDLGLLLLRLGLGICLFIHGFAKLTGGISFVRSMVVGAGLPEILSYGVYIGEVVAPLALIIGFYSRISSAIIAINSIVILYVAHPNLLALTQYGGFKAEILYLYIAMALCLVFMGSGKYAVARD